MTPDVVVFLIRAGMQVGSEAINALEQKVRDADIEVPDIALVRVSEMRRMLRLFQGELAAEVKARGPLAAFWDRQAQNGKGGPRTADPQAVPRLLARARRHWREQREAARANATTVALEKSDAEAGAVGDAIADDNVHLSDGLVTDIAVSALEVLAAEGPPLLERTDPWENVAADMVALVAGGMSRSLGRNGTLRFEQLFSRAQAVELAVMISAS